MLIRSACCSKRVSAWRVQERMNGSFVFRLCTIELNNNTPAREDEDGVLGLLLDQLQFL